MLWKHEAELGYPPTQARRLFDKINFQPGIGQIQRGAHSANAAANDHGRCRFLSDRVCMVGFHAPSLRALAGLLSPHQSEKKTTSLAVCYDTVKWIKLAA